MTRGGRARAQTGPERRCIVTGQSGPTAPLVRFVLSPDGRVAADIGAKLPGRGAWVTSDRDAIQRAVKRRLFNRAFKTEATAPGDLADEVERLLVQRLCNTLSLARKAGQAVTGFEKVRTALGSGRTGVLIQARDGSARERARLAASAREIPVIAVLDAAELGLAFGREFAIHAALDVGGFAQRALAEADRLQGLRSRDDGHAGQRMPGQDGQDTPEQGPAGTYDGERPGVGLSGQGDR